MIKILIKNGIIIDGSGNPPYKADIGIEKETIKFIGSSKELQASQVIDAQGRYISPGFIDMHSHSDFTLFEYPQAENKISQGVTTEVIGNCGLSPAPIRGKYFELLKSYLGLFDTQLPWNWLKFGEFLAQLLKGGKAVNIVPLVGHGALRAAAMGFDNRPPNSQELQRMKMLLEEALDSGAFGISTGLIYPPGCYANTEEIIELSKIVAKYGGIYASHLRNEGDGLVDSLAEAVRIGEEANLPVQISHLKIVGESNWGKIDRGLEIIERAKGRGLSIDGDQYPYTASSTTLTALLPHWTYEGGVEKLLERLRDQRVRTRVKEEIGKRNINWERRIISSCKFNKDYEGKSIAEIAQIRGVDPYQTVFDLLLEEGACVRMISFSISEEDVITVIKSPFIMIGSDSSAISTQAKAIKGKIHPRCFGTFPRVLSRYVKEGKVLSLEEAIRRMTFLPAQKLGLKDRGLIREGMSADLVIFNLEHIRDKATFNEPYQYSAGIEDVFVNGRLVLDQGQFTAALPGRILLR